MYYFSQKVEQARDDADTLIVKAALSFSEKEESVTVFANDTDVCIMLLYSWKFGDGEIVVRSDYKRNNVKHLKQMSISSTINRLSKCVISNLLVIHAFTGCDTTSAIYEKEKSAVLRMVEKSKKAQALCQSFMTSGKSREEIGNDGVALFLMMYGANENDNLTTLRYSQYMKLVAGSKKLIPAKLPPTKRSAWFHSHRVYLQVMQWKTLMDTPMDPLDWGWKMEKGRMVPVMTDEVSVSLQFS